MLMTAGEKKKEVIKALKYLHDNPEDWYAEYPLVPKNDSESEIINSTKNFIIHFSNRYQSGVYMSSINWITEFIELKRKDALVLDALVMGKELGLSQIGFDYPEKPEVLTKYVFAVIERALKKIHQ